MTWGNVVLPISFFFLRLIKDTIMILVPSNSGMYSDDPGHSDNQNLLKLADDHTCRCAPVAASAACTGAS